VHCEKNRFISHFFSNASITNQLILINFYFGLRNCVLYAAGDFKKYENEFTKNHSAYFS